MALSRGAAQRTRDAMLGGGSGEVDGVGGGGGRLMASLDWFAVKYRVLEDPSEGSRAKTAKWVVHEIMVQGESLHDASARVDRFLSQRFGEEDWEVAHIKTTKVESVLIDERMGVDASDGD